MRQFQRLISAEGKLRETFGITVPTKHVVLEISIGGWQLPGSPLPPWVRP